MFKTANPRRSDCPLANALEVIGDRWTLLVIRDLMFRGFREFGEFLKAGEGISTNILADRLQRLVKTGLVLQTDHPRDQKKFVYRLTEKGIDLAPILVELTLWGVKYVPDHAAPAGLVRQMRIARERLIHSLRRTLSEELKWESSKGRKTNQQP